MSFSVLAVLCIFKMAFSTIGSNFEQEVANPWKDPKLSVLVMLLKGYAGCGWKDEIVSCACTQRQEQKQLPLVLIILQT